MDEGRAGIIVDSDPQQKEAEGDLEMLIEGAEHMAVDDSEGAGHDRDRRAVVGVSRRTRPRSHHGAFGRLSILLNAFSSAGEPTSNPPRPFSYTLSAVVQDASGRNG